MLPTDMTGQVTDITGCAHEPLDEQSERRKLWLSPESEAHKALVRTVKDKRLPKDLDHLTKCIHTTTLEVMTAYMYLLVQKYNQHYTEKAAWIDSFEMSDIWKYKRAKVKMDPKKFKYILGVINEHHHWTLTIMIPQEKRAVFLDPLGETTAKIKKCQNVTRTFMIQKGYNMPRWACDTIPHSWQQDGSSCGAFVLKFAECFLKNEPLHFSTAAENVAALRMTIAASLLQNSEHVL
ncbi:uncharacterized protein [Chanodichthys erythropterus]|uniref:uncharacterized protein isoform X2 n=1 Tax=Chanodichthys erythropterus TaxID=933992 RepID=UPI00351EB2A6